MKLSAFSTRSSHWRCSQKLGGSCCRAEETRLPDTQEAMRALLGRLRFLIALFIVAVRPMGKIPFETRSPDGPKVKWQYHFPKASSFRELSVVCGGIR